MPKSDARSLTLIRMMRAGALLGLCGLFAMRPQGAWAADEMVSWPNRGPYQKVGDPHWGSGATKMPVPVVEALRQTLRGDPSRWQLLDRADFSGQHKRVLQISSKVKELPSFPGGVWAYASVLVEPSAWTNLGAPGSVPWLNGLLKPLRPAELQNRAKVKEYAAEIICLHKHPERFSILTPDFRQDAAGLESKLSDWLQGREKRPGALLALVHEISVSKDKDRVTLRCNVMPLDGSVERWTFHLRTDRAMKLEGVDIVELCQEETFSYAP